MSEEQIAWVGLPLPSCSRCRRQRNGTGGVWISRITSYNVCYTKLLRYQVLLARDGAQALQLAQESMPDLILLDLLMPGLNGDEVLRRLREQVTTRETAVIIVSARNAVEDEEAGFALGACDYITKPFNPAIVRARVRAALQMVNQRKLLDKLAYIDSLTELPNRRRFEQILTSEWNRCARSGSPLSLAMVDVDFFKRFNDTFGHAHGDRVLRAVAQQVARHLRRATDLAARLGGEERNNFV